ncbi:MAG: hypothetical protein HDT28_00470 [Clostridiales bacterium]|nr:hypothetical protein [Clostridiales bacterium]
MKKQPLKSLNAQLEKVAVAGLEIESATRGDYGYNILTGTLDGGIKVTIKASYQADDDPNAVGNLTRELESNVSIVRHVAHNLMPKGCALTEYDEGLNTLLLYLGLTVDGHPTRMFVRNYTEKPRLIFFSVERLMTEVEKSVKNHAAQLRTIIDTKGFEFIKYELLDMDGVVITGKAFGVKNAFTVKDFENENIAKRMKRELKAFKKLSRSGKGAPQKTIDLREYAELADAYAKSDKADSLYMNAYHKYLDSVRKANCESCGNYNGDKDRHSYGFGGAIDIDGRFSTCGKNCAHLDRVRKDMVNMSKKHDARDEFDHAVFVPAVIKFFEQVDPRFIHWLTGEIVSWRDIFPDAQTVIANNDIVLLHVLLSSGFSGEYIWENDVITLSGDSTTEDRKKVLALGQDVEHNISNTYLPIRDDNIAVNEQGKIAFNTSKKSEYKEYEINRYNITVAEVKRNIYRLSHNYALFTKPQDRYKVNAMLAVYHAFSGDMQTAAQYKSKAELDKRKITPDPKLETLLKAI